MGGQKLKLNCSRDKEMDVTASALVDGVAECSKGKCMLNIPAMLCKCMRLCIYCYCTSCISSSDDMSI